MAHAARARPAARRRGRRRRGRRPRPSRRTQRPVPRGRGAAERERHPGHPAAPAVEQDRVAVRPRHLLARQAALARPPTHPRGDRRRRRGRGRRADGLARARVAHRVPRPHRAGRPRGRPAGHSARPAADHPDADHPDAHDLDAGGPHADHLDGGGGPSGLTRASSARGRVDCIDCTFSGIGRGICLLFSVMDEPPSHMPWPLPRLTARAVVTDGEGRHE
ncbi:hypothetical protein FRIGORI9N_200013 [Frigoribacterium sp. 9N]|nr:hypothetical protein FRIGORI9N_200013 [Frigoribacterium sp. 9N]